jgi:hypothetical protein
MNGPNGVGPWWFPAWMRRALSWFSAGHFPIGIFDAHDVDYFLAVQSRRVCDRRFFVALWRAARARRGWRQFGSMMLAAIYYGFARLFGAASYNRAGLK